MAIECGLKGKKEEKDEKEGIEGLWFRSVVLVHVYSLYECKVQLISKPLSTNS